MKVQFYVYLKAIQVFQMQKLDLKFRFEIIVITVHLKYTYLEQILKRY